MTDKTAAVLAEIAAERDRQDARFGEQNHPNGTGGIQSRQLRDEAQKTCDAATERGTLTWLHISDEEHCEALAESDPVRLRAELVQDAAVKVAWIEALDRAALPPCPHCKGNMADPEDEGDWDSTVGAYNPMTRAPCPVCHGTGKAGGSTAATPATPGSLRDRIDRAIRPIMVLGLQDAELDGPGGTQRINEWADWITETVTTVRDIELYHMTLRAEGVEESVKTLTLALLKAGQLLNQVEADRDRRIEQLVGELDSRMAAHRRLASERNKRAEKAEAERDRHVATIERMKSTNRMVNGGARDARMRAEKAEAELKRLKSCTSSHCVEGDHVIDLGPAEETPKPPAKPCARWLTDRAHVAHEWESRKGGLVKWCPGR